MRNYLSLSLLAAGLAATAAFAPNSLSKTNANNALQAATLTVESDVEVDLSAPIETTSAMTPFPKAVEAFSGALTNNELVQMIVTSLDDAGYDREKTLVATSLCCDEVNRPLEGDLAGVYTNNFWMGGLAGFPFGGAVAFGAMAAHIPDGGSCLMVYGPHVGVDTEGNIGTVERRERANGGSCCGSAVAASGYVSDVLAGKAEKAEIPDDPIAAQQAYVGDMLLPFAQRLEDAENKMAELPMALYDAQSDVVDAIISKAAGGVADNGQIGVLGGVQINTPEGFSDYYLPLTFRLYDNSGKMVKEIIDNTKKEEIKVEEEVVEEVVVEEKVEEEEPEKKKIIPLSQRFKAVG
jgi:hypothetical protein